jgi:hypothetical protein
MAIDGAADLDQTSSTKDAADSGITTNVQPPLARDFCSRALKRLLSGPGTFVIDSLQLCCLSMNQSGEYRGVVALGTV